MMTNNLHMMTTDSIGMYEMLSTVEKVFFLLSHHIMQGIQGILGMMGILSLLGLELNPLTMIISITAIGFSVDFIAHTCYHFYHRDSSTNISNESIDHRIRRLAAAYFVIAEPIIEVYSLFINNFRNCAKFLV